MKTAYIYSLCLSGSDHVWYVGDTEGELSKRLEKHKRKAQKDRGGNKGKNAWIRKHFDRIEIRLIQTCSPTEKKRCQIFWITFYKAMNEPDFLNKKDWDECLLQHLRRLLQR